jgi:hypothetical protein
VLVNGAAVMDKLRETLTTLVDYISTIAPHGVVGGIVVIFRFVILGIDRVRVKIDGLTDHVGDVSRKVDSLTLAIEGRRGDAHPERKSPVGDDAEASLEEVRKKLEALSARRGRNIDAAK